MADARDVEIVVVGAGPAGLGAALAARRLGAEVLLLDEHGDAGGQYFMQPRAGIEPTLDAARQVLAGRDAIERVRAAGVEIWQGAEVWGLFPSRRLCVHRDGRTHTVSARRLIVATGAHDRVMAFPGWTLPGVMTAGGAQRLVKVDAVAPGRRAVIAGAGPFLLVVAKHLLAAGVEIAAYVETTRPSVSAVLGLMRFPEIWRELAGYAGSLLRSRAPVYLGASVAAAHGGESLERVTIARADEGAADRFDVAADLLAVAYGFRPQIELTMLAGCGHRFEDAAGGWVCTVDRDTGLTSADGVYAVGEVTGVAGWRVAAAEGRIAGLSAARSLDHWRPDADAELAQARRRRERGQRLADFVNRTFAPPAALVDGVTDDTVVCRCEDVPARAIRDAVESGAGTAGAVKSWTRCGMGPCQGRMCGWTLAHLLRKHAGTSPEAAGANPPRVPIKPIPVQDIVAG